MNIKCALGIELKSIFASRNLNAKYTVMICYAQSVLARCIINAESLFLPELLLFRSSIFRTVTRPRIVHLGESRAPVRIP